MQDDNDTRFGFSHRRLDCYHAAVALAVSARDLAAGLKPSERKLADQLCRASTAVPLLVAEGANRRHPREKRQRYNEALGECAETAAACELVAAFKLATADSCDPVLRLAERTAAMLRALVDYQDKQCKA